MQDGTSLALLGGLILAAVIASVRAPWRALLGESARQHTFMVCILLLALLWMGGIQVQGGTRLHLLGITPVVLIFGWELALLVGYLAAVLLTVLGYWAWPALAPEIFLSVLIPVAVTRFLLWLAELLPRTNLFVYLLGVGFAGGMFSMLATLLIGSWLQAWDLDHALALLLAFPEGFISGAIVTALAVFFPSIMRTYDDVRYLGE